MQNAAIPSDEMYQYIMKRIHLRKRKQMLFRAAAILIPLLSSFLGQFWYIDKRIDLFADSGYEEIYVPKGERMQLIFQDGSRGHAQCRDTYQIPAEVWFQRA